MLRAVSAAVAAILIFPLGVKADNFDRPIPQNSEQQERSYRDTLAWNQRTLGDSYEKVGRKDARWDPAARESLKAAARHFSKAVDPAASMNVVYVTAKQAVDSGCDDPMILYLYALASVAPNYPGPVELERRFTSAAGALEHSNYPRVWRSLALRRAALGKPVKDPSPEDRKEQARLFDAAVALAITSFAKDEPDPNRDDHLFLVLQTASSDRNRLSGDWQVDFKQVDAALASVPSLKVVRMQVRGQFFIAYAWQARGSGDASTVKDEDAETFLKRLTEAQKALKAAWALQAGSTRTATAMITVEKGLGGDRAAMEIWFRRAMEADGNNVVACSAKMDWLDPKWHGSVEDVLLFGKRCRATKNWRSGIPLLAADAHARVAKRLPEDERSRYFRKPEVWGEIKAVYEEFLRLLPTDNIARSRYAVYCFQCGHYAESHEQFLIAGKALVGTSEFPNKFMRDVRAFVAFQAKAPKDTKPVGNSPQGP